MHQAPKRRQSRRRRFSLIRFKCKIPSATVTPKAQKFSEIRFYPIKVFPYADLNFILHFKKLIPHSGKRKEFFIGLYRMCHEFSVPEQCISRDRRRYILRLFPVSNVNDLKRNIVRLCRFPNPRHPVTGEGALIREVQHEPLFLNRRMFCTLFEFRRHGS